MSKVVPSPAWQAGAGCWWEASVSPSWAVHRLLEGPQSMADGFPPERATQEKGRQKPELL